MTIKRREKPCGCKGHCGCELIKCAVCGKEYYCSAYSFLVDFILDKNLDKKPVCSSECRKVRDGI